MVLTMKKWRQHVSIEGESYRGLGFVGSIFRSLVALLRNPDQRRWKFIKWAAAKLGFRMLPVHQGISHKNTWLGVKGRLRLCPCLTGQIKRWWEWEKVLFNSNFQLKSTCLAPVLKKWWERKKSSFQWTFPASEHGFGTCIEPSRCSNH